MHGPCQKTLPGIEAALAGDDASPPKQPIRYVGKPQGPTRRGQDMSRIMDSKTHLCCRGSLVCFLLTSAHPG